MQSKLKFWGRLGCCVDRIERRLKENVGVEVHERIRRLHFEIDFLEYRSRTLQTGCFQLGRSSRYPQHLVCLRKNPE
jgi:hypothetical protein